MSDTKRGGMVIKRNIGESIVIEGGAGAVEIVLHSTGKTHARLTVLDVDGAGPLKVWRSEVWDRMEARRVTGG